MKIRAVFFDVDDTIYDSTDFAKLAREEAVHAMQEMGLPATEKEALKELGRITRKHGSNYGRHFDVLLGEFKVKGRPEIVAAGIRAYHEAKNLMTPYPEVYREVLRLRDAGYTVYVVTEGKTLKQWDKLIRLGVHHLFHDAFVSEEHNMRKEDGGLYRYALRKAGLKPEEVVVVGDREDQDILPAKRLGMRAIRVLRGKYSGAGKLGKSKADLVVSDLKGLKEKIERL